MDVVALGPGAVAYLLRLAAAAQSGRSLRTSVRISTLLWEGLVMRDHIDLVLPDRVPPLLRPLADRLTPPARSQFVADLKRQQTA